jgi:hypothetical protein
MTDLLKESEYDRILEKTLQTDRQAREAARLCAARGIQGRLRATPGLGERGD